MSLSPVVDALISVFEERKSHDGDGARFAVSRTVSLLAAIYEKARNAVEFRAEHLIRRAAIERIIKRRILLSGSSQQIAENLIVELLWAKYIDSSQVSDEKVATIQQILERYLLVKYHMFDAPSVEAPLTLDMLLGLASAEIEEILIPAKKRQALVNFFYQVIRPKINIEQYDEKILNMLTYIAAERGYAQSDEAVIYFHLLSMVHPEWLNTTKDTAAEQIPTFIENIKLIRKAMQDKVNEPLYRYVRKQTPAMLLIRDFMLLEGAHARTIVENQEEFERKLAEIAHHRYQEIGTKVRRSVVRSVIYIFLTKMIFALALEVPYDLFIAKRVDYIPLLVNVIFPPILLYLMAGFIAIPGQENTNRLIARIKQMFYNFDELKHERDIFSLKQKNRRPILTAIFSLLYLGTFLISFGFISFILTKFHFSIASQILFVFFVTLVSFFAYRIRQSAKEYEVVDRQGFLAPVMDFFFLPILRVGHILSAEIARLNFFIVLFDFILEAPLKVIFEVIEEWIRFIRTKKDEII